MRLQVHFNRSRRGSRGPWGSRALRLRTAGLLALVLAASLIGQASALAEKRVALVIGNGSYQGLPVLKNPLNDANDMAAALKARDFEVISGSDLGLAGMRDLVARFARAARTADVALVYYAGHGFQLSQQNYLVPVDAKIRSRDDIAQQTLRLSTIISDLEAVPALKVIFLDACRNNPLAKSGDAPSEGLENGLARVGNAAGFLISYATQPDNTAFDGGGRNSPFAKAVLSHMATQGQDVASMMISVRKDVLAATGGYQVPWENSSLTRQFYFAPGRAVAASPETQLWQLAAGGRDPALLKIYLQRFPEGPHAAEVRSMMGTQVASLSSETGAVRSTPENPSASDDRLWDLAQRSRMRPLVEFYLTRNPNGRHATEARDLLASLPEVDDVNAPPAQLCESMATHPRDATANAAGTPLAELARNAEVAINACRRATFVHPETPHYTALLARALAAGGRRDEAIKFYREAAGRGDLRAMVSLGLLMESGDGVPKDPVGAVALYERAAAKGSPDGAINLAVASMQGIGTPRDPARAVELLTRAAAAGSAIATYNLGVLAQDGFSKVPGTALDYFRKATELGDPRGYIPAAILLDEGRGVRKDPVAASRMLLQSVAADSGEASLELTDRAANWSADTIKAVQAELRKAGFYTGPVNGRGGKALADPLRQWRRFGSLDTVARQ